MISFLQPDRPLDQHQRPLGVLRLSLTARCNFACPYCLPDGQADTSLFASQGTDLRPWLRPVPNPSGLSLGLGRLWRQRQDRPRDEHRWRSSPQAIGRGHGRLGRRWWLASIDLGQSALPALACAAMQHHQLLHG